MIKKKIVMCPPDFYNIEYSINPWMDTKNKVNKEYAIVQYTDLKNSFQNAGVEVDELIPVNGLPDMVYATNAGYAGNNFFIRANFKAKERKCESDEAEKYFQEKGYEIFTIPGEIIFEGEGDLIRSESKYFLGCGIRSDKKSAEILGEIINVNIIPLELVNPYFYHLDTCFGPVNDNLAVINEKAFSNSSLKIIYDHFQNVITTSDKDNSVLACNLVVVGSNIFLGKGATADLKNKLHSFNYTVNEIEMSEFLKGGGSVKCLSLEIFDK